MTIRFILGLIIGAMIGALIALAVAPQPGSATRSRIWEQVKERTPRPHREAA